MISSRLNLLFYTMKSVFLWYDVTIRRTPHPYYHYLSLSTKPPTPKIDDIIWERPLTLCCVITGVTLHTIFLKTSMVAAYPNAMLCEPRFYIIRLRRMDGQPE